MPRVCRLWTVPEENLAASLYHADVPVAEIARRLRRPFWSVEKKLQRIAERARNRPVVGLTKRVVYYYERRKSDIEIARLCGVSARTVGVHRRRLGLPPHAYGPAERSAKTSDGIRRSLAEGGEPSAKVVADRRREQSVALGWPPCSAYQRRVLEALEAGGVMRTDAIAAAVGVRRVKTFCERMNDLRRAGWVEALTESGRRFWQLSASVADLRERWRIENRREAS